MKTLNLIGGCLIGLMSCSPAAHDAVAAEQEHPDKEMLLLEADLARQQEVMDSIAALREMEVAQQIIIEQQLQELKAKMLTGVETGPHTGLVSHSKKSNTPSR